MRRADRTFVEPLEAAPDAMVCVDARGRIALVDVEVERLLITAAVRDISERRQARAERARLERQLDQSRRLESLGQLAGEMAHDFNNLLAVIVGWTAIMSEELDEHAAPDKERVRMQVDEIDQAARRAAELTRQLLTFARRCGHQAACPVPRRSVKLPKVVKLLPQVARPG